MTETCDFDCWTETKRSYNWLIEKNATELATRYGFKFFEHPIYGDEAPVLAVRRGSGPAAKVWNTQDFDLPCSNPEEKW